MKKRSETKSRKLSSQEVRANLKKELKKRKLTYDEFARQFGKTEGWFSHIMTGRRKLTVELIYEIAEKLKVEPSSLFPEHPTNPGFPAFEEFIWLSIKGKLDSYLDEKFSELLETLKKLR